jgi:hypothetical protein
VATHPASKLPAASEHNRVLRVVGLVKNFGNGFDMFLPLIGLPIAA